MQGPKGSNKNKWSALKYKNIETLKTGIMAPETNVLGQSQTLLRRLEMTCKDSSLWGNWDSGLFRLWSSTQKPSGRRTVADRKFYLGSWALGRRLFMMPAAEHRPGTIASFTTVTISFAPALLRYCWHTLHVSLRCTRWWWLDTCTYYKMITAIRLVNTVIPSHNWLCVWVCVCAHACVYAHTQW